MSFSDDDVVSRKKKDEELVTWREYEALKSHLTRVFTHTTDAIDKNIQDVQVAMDQNVSVVTNIQTQVTALNTNVATFQHSIDALTVAIQQQQEHPHDDVFDDSDEGSAADAAPHHGRGCANPPAHVPAAAPAYARGFAPLGRAQRVPNQAVDDGLGKPKFSIPKFDGSLDPEYYRTWELKIEKLWRLVDYPADKKVKLVVSEFDGYALCWWDAIV